MDAMTDADLESRRRAARRREIAERILPVVEELIEAEQGFSNVTVAQVLDRSGLSRTTFYRHFSDKTDVLLALGEPALRALVQTAARAWESVTVMTRERLEEEMHRAAEAYLPHVLLLNAMVEASAYDDRVRQLYDTGFAEVRGAIASSLRRGRESGHVRAGLRPDEAAGWITWMVERGMSQMLHDAGLEERERLLAELADLVYRGVFEDDR